MQCKARVVTAFGTQNKKVFLANSKDFEFGEH